VERQKQADRILALLQAHKGEWVELPRILALGIACYTKRLSELRRDGNLIELRDNWTKEDAFRVRHTAYRWLGKLSDQFDPLRQVTIEEIEGPIETRFSEAGEGVGI
jgi:hypothetical protein